MIDRITEKEKTGIVLIVVALILTLIAFFMSGPIAQDEEYHNFSDAATLLAIPNALNVLSNIPFIFVGILGLHGVIAKGKNRLNILSSNRAAYGILFLGAILVGFGSGYYHLWPNNETLAWDRAPMTIAFMGLYSVIIAEFVSEKMGRLCLLPLLFLGLASVVYWRATESLGMGDLRFYGIVQFFPIVTIPVMLLFFRPTYSAVSGYWLLLATYVLAKLLETYDAEIHSWLGLVSGHSIKHVVPAIGLYLLLNSYRVRTKNIHHSL